VLQNVGILISQGPPVIVRGDVAGYFRMRETISLACDKVWTLRCGQYCTPYEVWQQTAVEG
jgi:hypothetical protein